MYNQHLGLLDSSRTNELNYKETAYKNVFKLQNYQVKKYLKFKNIDINTSEIETKIKLLQSGLSNISQFNGKG